MRSCGRASAVSSGGAMLSLAGVSGTDGQGSGCESGVSGTAAGLAPSFAGV